MSALPGVNQALDYESPHEAYTTHVNGAYWQPDWRGTYLVSDDEIHNHNVPEALGVIDGADNASEWNQYQGAIQSDPISIGTQREIALLGAPAYMQIMRIPQPDAIDQRNRQNTNGQVQLTGVDSIAAMVPYLELPDYGQELDPSSLAGFGGRGGLPFHFDVGFNQNPMSSTIGPRQIFRSPPAYSDQTAAVVAAGL